MNIRCPGESNLKWFDVDADAFAKGRLIDDRIGRDMTHKAIAAELGISKTAVRTLKSRERSMFSVPSRPCTCPSGLALP